MKLNGVMRLRIVLAGIILALSTSIWGIALFDAFEQLHTAEAEFFESKEQAEREKSTNVFDQFDDDTSTVGPWTKYQTDPIALDVYQEDVDRSQSAIGSIYTVGILYALLPVAAFWLLGSIVGWVYRGFANR